MRLGFFLRALGRAYLAFCEPAQVDTYVRQAIADGAEGHKLARDTESLFQMIASIRWKGYALRDKDIEPRSSDTIAVPIFLDGAVRATLGVTFFRSALRCEAAISDLATMLKEASAEITRETERLRARSELEIFG